MKEKLFALYTSFIYLFAFCSSVYSVSLLLQKVTNTKNDCISSAFFICIFALAFFININSEKKE